MHAHRRTILTFVIAFVMTASLQFVMTGAMRTAAAVDADATVTVAHFAPFAATLDGTSVTVEVNGSAAITDFVFGETAPDIPLPAGTYTIEVVPTGSVTPALSFTATLDSGVDYTLAAIGDAANQPLEPYVLVNDNTPFTDTGKVRITHLSPFSNTLAGTAVDICTNAGDPVSGLEGIEYKDSTGYLPLAAGIYDLLISPAGTDCAPVLDIPPFALQAGQIADIFAIGLPGSAELPLQVYQEGLKARMTVAHFAPFASSPVSTSVSVKLDGSEVLTDFVFPEYTSYLDVAPGDYQVQVIPTGATEPAISGTAVISGFLDYTFAAVGNGTLQPLGLFRLDDDNATPPSAGNARVRITHLAPFAATETASEVDICTALGAAPLVSKLAYQEFVTTELPAGVYAGLFVAAPDTDCTATLFGLPDFVLEAGDIAYLYAVGDITNIAPSVVANPPFELAARVKVAHFAPFAATAEGTAVSVLVNGSEVLTDFVYSEVTSYLPLAPGNYDLEVMPEGAAAAATDAITASVVLSPGVDYTVAAIGDGDAFTITLQPFVDDNTTPPPAGQARVRLAHLAPFADTLAGTTVDVCTAAGSTPLIDDFVYGEAETLNLQAGLYTSVFLGKADPDCSEVILPLSAFLLTEGQTAYLYAIGNGADFAPVAINAQGDVAPLMHYLPAVNKLP